MLIDTLDQQFDSYLINAPIHCQYISLNSWLIVSQVLTSSYELHCNQILANSWSTVNGDVSQASMEY